MLFPPQGLVAAALQPYALLSLLLTPSVTANSQTINAAPTASTITAANTKSFTGTIGQIALPAITPAANGAGITLTGFNFTQGAISNVADSEAITVKQIIITGAAGAALETGVYTWSAIEITIPNQAANGANNQATGIKVTGGTKAGGASAYQRGIDITMAAATDTAIIVATGVSLFADGTVGAPGIAISSDPDCGLYLVAANTLGIAAGGALAFKAQSDGKLVFNTVANTGIFCTGRDDFLTFCASPTSDQSGGMLALSGGDRVGFEGWICLDIGDRRAGKNAASKIDFTYSWDTNNVTYAYMTYQGALQMILETVNAGIFVGASQDGAFQWDVADADANCLKIGLPAGAGANVPVVMFGTGIAGIDLTWFNGYTIPTLAVIDADRDSYIALSWNADDQPAILCGGAATAIAIQNNLTLAANIAISTGSVAGVANAVTFNMPIGAGGAANGVLQWAFQLDSVIEAGLLGETDGAGTYTQGKTIWKIPYRDSGANVAAPTAPTTAATWLGGVRVEAGDDTNRIYFYANEAWHYINQTAGFEIPAHETVCPHCGKDMGIGDDVIGTVDRRIGDGALHGVWRHARCKRR